MKTYQHIFLFTIGILFAVACKKESNTAEKKTATIAKTENVSFAISGMTCEIGCAKTIQSKLSKKEGVTSAKVIFTDSIANITFDVNSVSKKELISFVNGIAGGLYTASEITTE